MKLDLFHDRRHKVLWHRARKLQKLVSGRNNHVVHPEDIDEVPVEENPTFKSRHAKSIMQHKKQYSTQLYQEEYPHDEVYLQKLEMDMTAKEEVREADLVEAIAAELEHVQVAEAIPFLDAEVQHLHEYTQQKTDDDIVPLVEAHGDCAAAPAETALEAVCVQVPSVETASVNFVFEETIQTAELHNADNAATESTLDGDQEDNSMPTPNLQSPVPVMSSNDLLKLNLEAYSLKKKLARNVNSGEFTPYGEFFGVRRGDQPVIRKEDRHVNRLVGLAKMQCASLTFSQRPNINHIQYVQSLGLFYASQPILTTKPKVEAPAAVLPDVTRLARRKEIPLEAAREISTKGKKTTSSRKRLLPHLFPWLWHFPSPRSFGKVAHPPTFAHEQPHDMPMVDNEHAVRRILI